MITQQGFTRKFIDAVHSMLEPDELADVIATDAKAGPDAISSIHQYIDLNEAYLKVMPQLDPTSERELTLCNNAYTAARARNWEPVEPFCELVWAKDATIELLGDTLLMHTPTDVLDKLLFVVDGQVIYDIDRCKDGGFSAEVMHECYTGTTAQEVLLKMDDELTDNEYTKEIMAATSHGLQPFTEWHSFPNGFRSWMETHHEVVDHLTNTRETAHTMANQAQQAGGQAELYDLALELTEQFEQAHKGEEWGITREYFDTIENWLQKKDCKNFLGDKVAVFNNHVFGNAVNDGTIQPGMLYCIDMRPNPLGDWSLIISSEGDLIDTYYYDSRQEAQEDVDELAIVEIELIEE